MGWTPHTQEELINAGAQFGSSDENMPFVIYYPDQNGVTSTANQQYSSLSGYDPQNNSSDPYGGTPITINTGNSAAGLQSLSATLNNGFSGLFDMIMRNTDANNAFSASQAKQQMAFQERMNQMAMSFNAGEAAKNRDWQKMMSNTAHQREVADLKAAGLNPVLSASGGNGAAVGSGATAAGASVPSGSKADADQSANMALASIYGALINANTQMQNANLTAKTNLKMAEMQNETSRYAAQLGAEASRYAAGTNYAASTYGADMAFKNNEAQREWTAAHPQTTAGAVSSALTGGFTSGSTSGKGILGSVLNALGNLAKPGSYAYNHWRSNS